jgi:hypothetical protein
MNKTNPEMKKYKVIKEDKKLSDTEIVKYRNFSELAQSYQRATKRPKEPLYKNKWMFIALVIIILLTLWICGEI